MANFLSYKFLRDFIFTQTEHAQYRIRSALYVGALGMLRMAVGGAINSCTYLFVAQFVRQLHFVVMACLDLVQAASLRESTGIFDVSVANCKER